MFISTYKCKLPLRPYHLQEWVNIGLGKNKKSVRNIEFKIDTGSPFTIIQQRYLTEVNYNWIDNQFKVPTANKSLLTLRSARIQGILKLGDVTIYNPIIYIANVDNGNNLLGCDIIECCKDFKLSFSLDANKKIILMFI